VLANEPKKIPSTTVSGAISILQDSQISVSRNLVVHLFKQLQRLECGRFVVGRHNNYSRMIWNIDLRELRSVFPLDMEAAASKSSANQQPAFNESKHPARLVPHQFYLRESQLIKFDLPSDFSPIEARRLGKFLESLPLTE
jgi:hypothetical protein